MILRTFLKAENIGINGLAQHKVFRLLPNHQVSKYHYG